MGSFAQQPSQSSFGSLSSIAGTGAATGATSESAAGKVKVWYEDKGFGFIAPDDNRFGNTDIFVHRSKLHDGQSLVVGSPVVFKAEWNTTKGKYAIAELSGASSTPAAMPG